MIGDDDSIYDGYGIWLVIGLIVIVVLVLSTAPQGTIPNTYGGGTYNSYNSYHYEDNDTSIDVCIGVCK